MHAIRLHLRGAVVTALTSPIVIRGDSWLAGLSTASKPATIMERCVVRNVMPDICDVMGGRRIRYGS